MRRAGVQNRQGNDDTLGDLSVHPRKKPSINTNASSLLELIHWFDGVYEPPMTCQLTTFEVKKFINEPMQVAQWPGCSVCREVCETSHGVGRKRVYTRNAKATSEVNKVGG